MLDFNLGSNQKIEVALKDEGNRGLLQDLGSWKQLGTVLDKEKKVGSFDKTSDELSGGVENWREQLQSGKDKDDKTGRAVDIFGNEKTKKSFAVVGRKGWWAHYSGKLRKRKSG